MKITWLNVFKGKYMNLSLSRKSEKFSLCVVPCRVEERNMFTTIGISSFFCVESTKKVNGWSSRKHCHFCLSLSLSALRSLGGRVDSRRRRLCRLRIPPSFAVITAVAVQADGTAKWLQPLPIQKGQREKERAKVASHNDFCCTLITIENSSNDLRNVRLMKKCEATAFLRRIMMKVKKGVTHLCGQRLRSWSRRRLFRQSSV